MFLELLLLMLMFPTAAYEVAADGSADGTEYAAGASIRGLWPSLRVARG